MRTRADVVLPVVRTMGALACLSALALPAPGQQDTEAAVGRSVVSGAVRVTLRRLFASARGRGHCDLLVEASVTDRSGWPLARVRSARAAIPGLASSDPRWGSLWRSSRLRLVLPMKRLPTSTTLVIELEAANLPPTRVWPGVPLQPTEAPAPAPTAYRDRHVEARVVSCERDMATSETGRPAVPRVIVRVAETTVAKTAANGFVAVEGPGLVQHGYGSSHAGAGNIYDATALLEKAPQLPARVTVRYYSSPAVTAALHRHRFVFDAVRLPAQR